MRNRNEFVQLIDRYRLGQAQRLSIGLAPKTDFSAIMASLVLAEGRGKFLRPRWIENREFAIPDSISIPCKAAQSSEIGLREFAQLRIDLTRVMATAANQMATLSANHSRMLLDVCVHEPGLWLRDYDGKTTWQAYCEPTLLAEQTGLTTIDALPNRDIACDGRGWPIDSLVHWLMFADRDRTVADKPRLLVKLAEMTELVWLPESDGLDDEIPALRYRRLLGLEFLNGLLAACHQADLDPRRLDEYAAQGKLHAELASLWEEFVARSDLDRVVPQPGDLKNLIQESKELINDRKITIGDALMTFASHIGAGARQFLDKRSSLDNLQLIPAGELNRYGILLSELNQRVDVPWLDTIPINYDPFFVESNVAAIAGLLHLDQMPVTVPWLTGGSLPRVIGRLTPGSPANWRRVIMEMGDCYPPVMKLRDAV